MLNPEWCDAALFQQCASPLLIASDCSCLANKKTAGGGVCIGKLAIPTDHIEDAANDLSFCLYDSEKVTRIYVNKYDFDVWCYLFGEAFRKTGQGADAAIVNNLPLVYNGGHPVDTRQLLDNEKMQC